MKYEINENTENKHTIESNNMLCCGENGRVIATFYNDYDLDDVIKLEKENEALKADNSSIQSMGYILKHDGLAFEAAKRLVKGMKRGDLQLMTDYCIELERGKRK